MSAPIGWMGATRPTHDELMDELRRRAPEADDVFDVALRAIDALGSVECELQQAMQRTAAAERDAAFVRVLMARSEDEWTRMLCCGFAV